MLLCLLPGATLVSRADGSETELIQQMDARLASIVELKLAGKVGENNRALLEARSVLDRDERRLLSQENRDRLAFYEIIADRTGVALADVQAKRAQAIRENSPKRVWLQSPSGDWYRE
ncbi:DUF1318 domain-containing protein [Coraliomargarita parva]|uniref:DUF1318 domain-containing protein n=1 Tax=Coraliomargarita parva TaxID=3014050 RepID=UPI0022B3E892|nr:DUF1318 domain-containing protein [Coraliomargarita parva]